MFVFILDFADVFHTVISRRLHRIFWGLADSLAASILMPRTVFYQYCRELLRHAGVPRGYLTEGNYGDKLIFQEIVQELMTAFGVSSRAAQIRMVHLGLIRRAA